MTTLERNVPFERLIQQCHRRSAQDPGKGCYCFRQYLSPASCGIYENVARVTENTGLCDVNVIQSDNSLQPR